MVPVVVVKICGYGDSSAHSEEEENKRDETLFSNDYVKKRRSGRWREW